MKSLKICLVSFLFFTGCSGMNNEMLLARARRQQSALNRDMKASIALALGVATGQALKYFDITANHYCCLLPMVPGIFMLIESVVSDYTAEDNY